VVVASALLTVTPLYLRSPAGFGIYAASVLLSLYAFVHPPGMEWFLPLFYLSFLLGQHAAGGTVPAAAHARRDRDMNAQDGDS
jgi:hypothetical protein